MPFPMQRVCQRESGVNSPIPKSEHTKAHVPNERTWAFLVAQVFCLRIPEPPVLTSHYQNAVVRLL